MRLIRYRRPSMRGMLGLTRAKKQFRRRVGYTAAMRPFRAPGNYKRRLLRRAGYYSEPMKFLRWLSK